MGPFASHAPAGHTAGATHDAMARFNLIDPIRSAHLPQRLGRDVAVVDAATCGLRGARSISLRRLAGSLVASPRRSRGGVGGVEHPQPRHLVQGAAADARNGSGQSGETGHCIMGCPRGVAGRRVAREWTHPAPGSAAREHATSTEDHDHDDYGQGHESRRTRARKPRNAHRGANAKRYSTPHCGY